MKKFRASVLAVALLAIMPVKAEINKNNLLKDEIRNKVSMLSQNNIQKGYGSKLSEESINKLKAAARRVPVTKTATQTLDVVYLDSVISENRKVYYKYNDHGWLISKEVYNLEDYTFVLNTDESFRNDYEFDSMDRIVNFAYYEYNEDGSAYVTERMTSTWTGPKSRNEKYYSISEYDEWEGLQLVTEIDYDEFGNISQMKEYEWDYDNNTMELDDFFHAKYSRNVMEYYYTEDGLYDGMDFNEELVFRYMTYYVEADKYELYGEKVETKVDGLTTTNTIYTVDNYFEGEQDIEKLIADIDSYWEFAEEEVITLTPKGNRFASLYYYSAPLEEDMPSYDDQPSYDEEVEAIPTRSQTNRVLENSYVMEYDELDRLIKCVEQNDEEDDIYTRTFTYYNDKAYNITLADLEDALYNYWEKEDYMISPMSGYLYGEVKNARSESDYGYSEILVYKYDANGNILHQKETEHIYSDVEMDYDLNGDGIMSTESETIVDEYWFTYDENNEVKSEIHYAEYEDPEYQYQKTEYVSEMTSDGYLIGEKYYNGTSENGPWTIESEFLLLYKENIYEVYETQLLATWWRRYNKALQLWFGEKTAYINDDAIIYEIDPATGEFIEPADTQNSTVPTRSGFNLQQGDNFISFVEDNWQYEGNIWCDYIYNEQTQTEELTITDGRLMIIWTGSTKGKFNYNHPSDNYIFPVGPIFYGIEVSESVNMDNSGMIELSWDMETEQWISHYNQSVNITNHTTNSQGNVIEISGTYTFNPETERMDKVAEDTVMYVFDEYKRLAYITDNSSTTFFNYLSKDSNYLLESFTVDAAGNKYDVCKYYYSNGKYSFPYTEVKDIDASTEWNIDGRTITANGTITLFNMNGMKVATENGILQVPESGIYIMDINGKRTKISIR